MAFSPDGKLLATAGADETVRLWDVSTGKALVKYFQANTSLSVMLSVAFRTPDGNILASGSTDNEVWLWDVENDRLLGNLQEHTGSVFAVAFSTDGKMLASGSDDKTVRLWNLDPTSWISRTCTLVNRNLSMGEWADDIRGNVPYRRTCPALPAGRGAAE